MLIQPVLRPVLQPVLRSIFDPGIGGGGTPIWTPASLFAKYGGIGGYWDFTDMATLFQDSAGTTPVTAASQPVGRVLDLSGQGNHVIQSTAGARPQYNGAGITPDGVDDFMATASIDFTGCDKVVVAMGYTKLDSTARAQVELSYDPSGSYSFWLSNGPDYFNQTAGFRPGGSVGFTSAVPNEYGAHIGRGAIKPGLGEGWWNAAKATNAISSPNATITFGNHPLYFLSRGGTSKFSNTPARRALAMGVPVAGTQVSDDDIELIRLWLMEGVV